MNFLFGNNNINNINNIGHGNNNNNNRGFYRQGVRIGRWGHVPSNIISFIPFNERICFLGTNKSLIVYNFIDNQIQLTIDKGVPLAEKMLKLKNKKVLLINNYSIPQFSIIC